MPSRKPAIPPTQKPADPSAQPAEPWFALPLSDLQAFQTFLQRKILDGQDAQVLLNKLAGAVPATLK